MVASASVYSRDIRCKEKKTAPHRDDKRCQLRPISFVSSRKSNPEIGRICGFNGTPHFFRRRVALPLDRRPDSTTCATCLDSGEEEAGTAPECANVAWSHELTVNDTP